MSNKSLVSFATLMATIFCLLYNQLSVAGDHPSESQFLNVFKTDLDDYAKDPVRNGESLISGISMLAVFASDPSDNIDPKKFAEKIKAALDSHNFDINQQIQLYQSVKETPETFENPFSGSPDSDYMTYKESYLACTIPTDLHTPDPIFLSKYLQLIRYLHVNLDVFCGGQTVRDKISADLSAGRYPHKKSIAAFLRHYDAESTAAISVHKPTNTLAAWNVGRNCVNEIKEQDPVLTTKYGLPVEIEIKSCGRCPDSNNSRAWDLRAFEKMIEKNYRPSSTVPLSLYNQAWHFGAGGNCIRHLRAYSQKPLLKPKARRGERSHIRSHNASSK